jgi:threonine dehydrogenase-like Zn-dependent dehydrogenase
MRFENFPLPERVAPGNVRIEIKAVGICGSDVHYWRKVSVLFAGCNL